MCPLCGLCVYVVQNNFRSRLKPDKLATLKKAIFRGELGTLSQQTLTEVNKKLKIALGLD